MTMPLPVTDIESGTNGAANTGQDGGPATATAKAIDLQTVIRWSHLQH
jgi:hypothetical protein